ncbi:hypothetical protein HK097_002642 [Rhizophlyctis rosea]|uniref:Kri1-like C-terminal domain-containing protein n=1 Tax=Rhizophlyctis rosea TaxID=64517 RepID=A0AAD5SMT3_9FUNG|nr:hypothetical protein HK097_002642 [Rhizophlyctis rosea]
MDADYLPGGEEYADGPEEGDGKKKKKDKKGKEKKEKLSLDQYLDEYYQMDYEDMIGDLPTRFKYRQVDSDTVGLTPYEILEADDADLNEYYSLKKLAPFRRKDLVERDREKFKKYKKKKLREFRKKTEEKKKAESGVKVEAEVKVEAGEGEKKKKKKKVKVEESGDVDVKIEDAAEVKQEFKKVKQQPGSEPSQRKHKKSHDRDGGKVKSEFKKPGGKGKAGLSADRLASYQMPKKK